jgi:hypothetical protein
VRLFDAGFHAGCLCSESEFFFSPLIPLAFPAAVLKHYAHRAPSFRPSSCFFCEQPKLVQAASEIGAAGGVSLYEHLWKSLRVLHARQSMFDQDIESREVDSMTKRNRL